MDINITPTTKTTTSLVIELTLSKDEAAAMITADESLCASDIANFPSPTKAIWVELLEHIGQSVRRAQESA